ncbi:hypothetical protein PISL3812_05492 [Talaromyces islandicus]|uniref:G-protein coupled receptors family 2 profile 2 domain-containing protein n=1 Tax=Talaromyces islandicus TaxID=28573 RepID=A0A0U1LZD3_TALIS|nr:hypothetical protein PISL3812_05492 [Talaromyces islandicus]
MQESETTQVSKMKRDSGSVPDSLPGWWDFEPRVDLVGLCAIPVFAITFLFILTFAILPKEATGRHYLTTVPAVGFLLLSLTYILPHINPPEQCADHITPNDNTSDSMCTATGVVICVGVWLVVISCVFRALSLHLYVVWEKKLGPRFMIVSLSCIFIGTIIFTVMPYFVTGVSYQFGKVCYLKPSGDNWAFLAPLIVLAAGICGLQIWTLIHCVMSVLQGIWVDRRYSTQTSREVYHDGRTPVQSNKLLTIMQWRPMLAAFGIVLHVAMFCALFIIVRTEETLPADKFDAWVKCLVSSPDDTDRCLPETDGFWPNEDFVFTCFLLLSTSGLWGVILVMRRSMVYGWVQLFKSLVRSYRSPDIDLELHTWQRFSETEKHSVQS